MKKLLLDLKEYGADIEGAMNRFLNDEELYVSCFYSFLEDVCFKKLGEAIVQKDYKNAFDYAHTLKGVAGNMGLSPIYKAICDIVEPLRRNDYSNLQYLYAEIIENYNKLQAYRVEEKRYEC